ncbi:macrolide ABC transporter ATP-binding protein [Desulfovibrio sp. An276]|uniref:ABC transporter ATP-binding protein n=1 Tax=Desulfovibrio sp. An276 TaxID=1965618 RepID=UPI000B5865D9|nr:ABC transporter ATP-binding protein [Desulfovibrio sp. An276]OUO53093.1 macrolide ABC transporter ATP-binding protein [Desulfovibrio sp. An276]
MTSQDTPLVDMRHIGKTFVQADMETHVLHDICLEVWPGDFLALTGSSGSGKSTLLYIMGLLDQASSGTYRLKGQDVSTLDDTAASAFRNTIIGFVFQSFFLIPYASALDNVLLPGAYGNVPDRELRARAEELLVRVGLGDRMHHRPNQLSGGQQQRVALARALLGNPALLLADEPTGQLDTATSHSILELFTRVNDRGTTIIMVTHSPETAACARRRIVMRDGCIHPE